MRSFLRRLWLSTNPAINQRQLVCRRLFSTEEVKNSIGGDAVNDVPPIDPKAALEDFYGEELTPTLRATPVPPKPLGKLKLDVDSIRHCINHYVDAPITTIDREGRGPQLIVELATNRERLTLADDVKRDFKPLRPRNSVPSEGMDSDEADWIVLDLGVAMLHIVSPEARKAYALDEVFSRKDTLEHEQDSRKLSRKILSTFAKSVPRKAAGDPMRRTPSEDAMLRKSLFEDI